MPLRNLVNIYQTLYARYGNLRWQPADTPFEVIVGAILTQNTAWTNAEKAMNRFDGNLSAEQILNLPAEEIQEIIRPAGFYRQKSQYLKAAAEWFMSYTCDPDLIKSRSLPEIRSELLRVRGIGNETADSILLYAFNFPVFVVDAYIMRFFRRFPVDAGKAYMEVQIFCEMSFLRTQGSVTTFTH